MAAQFVFGVVAWSLAEYLGHRFALHGFARRGHMAGHHCRPADYSIGPGWPAIAITVAIVIGAAATLGFAAFGFGALAGFTFYVGVHRASHHGGARPRPRWLAWLVSFHAIHHAAPGCNFGVSSPFWDLLLFTYREPRASHGRP